MGNTNISLPDGQRSATTDQVDAKIAEQIASGPPVNVDVPHASQQGDQLICTMGNWQGEPRTYEYQWRADGEDLDLGQSSVYTLAVADIGKTFDCEVSASHSGGETRVVSNPVTVESV